MMRGTLIGGAAALLLAWAPVAGAGALRVSPVGLDLPGGRATATLTLRNDDATPMNVQVRVFHWTQGPDGDELTQTSDVVVSPPIAPLAPNSERVIRLVRTAPEAEGEASYRVIVDELPPPPDARGQQVQLLMRHSIPVFFTHADRRAKVAWSVSPPAQGAITITGANTGGRRLRVANLRLLDPKGVAVAERPGLVGYVLSGAVISWSIPVSTAVPAGPLRLIAETDAGPLEAPLSPHL